MSRCRPGPRASRSARRWPNSWRSSAEHLADALQAEAAAAQIAEYGEFGQILGRVKTAMTLAGRHYDSLLIPPLELACGEAGALANLAGCKALLHALHQTGRLENRLQRNNMPQYV